MTLSSLGLHITVSVLEATEENVLQCEESKFLDCNNNNQTQNLALQTWCGGDLSEELILTAMWAASTVWFCSRD